MLIRRPDSTLTCRPEDLRALADLAHGAEDGALALVGPAGSGRSTLLRSAARLSGATSVLVTVDPGESTWSLSGLTSALIGIDGRHGTDLHGLAIGGSAATGPSRLAPALVARLSARPLPPTLLLIDDADDLDPESQQVLGHLVRHVRGTGLRIVLSCRGHLDAGPLRGIDAHRLGPVDRARMLDLARSLAPSDTPPGTVQLLVRIADGNPGLLTDILDRLSDRALRGEEPMPAPLGLSDAAMEATWADLVGLGDPARRTLEALSCAPYLPTSVASRARSVESAGLDELVAGGWVRRTATTLHIASTRVRATAYGGTPAARRLALHTELAGTAEGRDDRIAAWHRCFAPPDDGCPVELLGAASSLVVDDMLDAALEFAERALVDARGADVGPALTEFAMTLVQHAELGLARRYEDTLHRMYQGISHPPRLVVLGTLLDLFQGRGVGTECMARELGVYGQSDPVGCLAMVGTVVMARLLRWELDEAEAQLPSVRDLAPARPELAEAIEALTRLCRLVRDGGEVPSYDEIRRHLNPLPVPRELAARAVLLHVLIYAERFGAAREILAGLRESTAGAPPLWGVVVNRAALMLDLRSDAFRQARAGVDRARSSARALQVLPVELDVAEAVLLAVEGRAELAHERLEQVLSLVPLNALPAVFGARVHALRGRLAWMQGEGAEALDRMAMARRVATGVGNPQLVRAHADHVEFLVRMGRRAEAREVLAEFRARAAAAPSRWATFTLARCEALVAEGARSLELFDELLGAWPACELEYEHARTLLCSSERLEQAGHGKEALAHQRAAERLLADIGVAMPSELCTTHDARTAEPVPEILSTLNEREAHVARLVQQGYRNRSIAQDLYVSVRTVEMSLTRIYRKVGVSSRAELIRAMSGERG